MAKIPPQLPPTKSQNWIRNFRIQDVFATMASPPTITLSTGATSPTNGSYNTGTTMYNVQHVAFECLGGAFVDGFGTGGVIPTRRLAHISNTSGVKSPSSSPVRVRFATDAEKFDLGFYDAAFSQFNLIVDGKLVKRSKALTFTNTGNYRYVTVDFGTNVTTYQKTQVSVGSIVGGTGHAVGDIITMNGGSGGAGGSPVTFKVTQVSSGVIVNVDIQFEGAYTSLPTGTLTQASTTGSGTGFTCAATFFNPVHSTRKLRNIELIYSEPAYFVGIVLPSAATNWVVTKYKANPLAPRFAFIGDSITIGTYIQYGAAHMGASIAQRLNVWDKMIISGNGGTGWSTTNGTSANWAHANRLQDYLDYDADVYVFIGSQNDAGKSAATIKADIETVLNHILTNKPKALIVGIGNILGDSTTLCNDIQAGFESTNIIDSRRVRFINNHTPLKWLPSSALGSWTCTNDLAHLSPQGLDLFANIAAEHIYQAVCEMAA